MKWKPGKKTIALVLIAALGGGGYWAYLRYRRPVAGNADSAETLDRTFTVKRDNLTIGLLLSGTVSASAKHKLALQANFKTKLLTVVDENSQVKAGDLLATFETDELKERIEELQTNKENQEKELALAIENEKIQVSTNLVDLANAKDRLMKAEDALVKYYRLERTKTRDSYDLAIENAKANLETAQSNYDTRADEINKAGSGDEQTREENEKELLDLQAKISTAKNSLKSAQLDLKSFKRYDNPNKLMTLRSELEQSRLNMEKARIYAESQMVQKRRHISNLQRNLRNINNQLNRHLEYMEQMKLIAPVDGIVIYADPDRRWGNPDIKLGMDVWKGMVLMTIPEMSNLVVDFDLPEQYRSRTRLRDKVVITPDSLPTLKIDGEIAKIATLPTFQIASDSSSPKVYNSRIRLLQQHPKLVNGMSVQVQIISKIIENTLFVPVEAVFENNNKFFVYRQTALGPQETIVEIGESNDNFVQITNGLEEGDVVYLYRPYQQKES